MAEHPVIPEIKGRIDALRSQQANVGRERAELEVEMRELVRKQEDINARLEAWTSAHEILEAAQRNVIAANTLVGTLKVTGAALTVDQITRETARRTSRGR